MQLYFPRWLLVLYLTENFYSFWDVNIALEELSII
jgi:hypothetical protein